MKVIGLTGGIATGKSTVSAVIEEEGLPLIDCDKIARAVVEKGKWGHRRVVKAFGSEIQRSNGELDREALGALIFSDRSARQKLNKATHTPVFAELLRQLFICWLKFQPLVVIDMPLLFETNSHKLTSANVLVACEESTQVDRLMKRDSCTKEQARAKVSSQMPLAQKQELSNFVIDNNGSRQDTRHQAVKIIKDLKKHSLLHQIFLGPGALVGLGAIIWKLISLMR